jgi:hypothetical protein
MAISPNVDFVSGAILTATQQNQFPRGIMAQAKATTNVSFGGTEVVTITASTFTAVANRYYKITYFEPTLPAVQNGNTVAMKIRVTNTSGTVLGTSFIVNNDSNAGTKIPQTITALVTFSAGSVVLVGTCISPGLFTSTDRSTDAPAVIIVEDVGPA